MKERDKTERLVSFLYKERTYEPNPKLPSRKFYFPNYHL